MNPEMEKKTDGTQSGAPAPCVLWRTLFRRAILAWLTAALVEFALLPEAGRVLDTMDSLGQMSLIRMIVVMAVVFGALVLLGKCRNTDQEERLGMFLVFSVLILLASGVNRSMQFALALLFAAGLMLRFFYDGMGKRGLRWEEGTLSVAGTAMLALLFFLFVRNWGVSRVKVFATPSYDFGIFAQMFHNMRTTGLPMTTLERDGLLSHFQVHMSPIYYLMLPFYCLVPKPETLQVLQAAVLASAVIPLWLLGKQHGLRPVCRMLLCAVLLAFPAYAGGTSYDLHENCFLTPLLLWLFYGVDRKSVPITAVSALLTLMVKEDAAVYVAVLGLWLVVRSLLAPEDRVWGIRWGSALLGISVAWFLAVTWYLASHGDGVMTGRYDNLMYGDSDSLLSVIKTALLNPMKVLYECVDEEKLEYITYTMVPLLGIPLFSKRYDRLLLLIPYMLLNLMSDYTYQHSILFQYSYGSTAFLIYLLAVNLAEWKQDWKRITALALALIVASMCFGKEILPLGMRYPSQHHDLREDYEAMDEVLEQIPEDVPVAATTFLTTALSDREILYDIQYAQKEHILECDYVALKISNSGGFRLHEVDGKNGYGNFVAFLLENGYALWKEGSGIEIYRRS